MTCTSRACGGVRKLFSWALGASVVGLALAVVLPLGGCAARKGDTAVLSYDAAEASGLRQRWLHQVGLAPGEKVANLWRVGDGVYVLTNRNILHSINAATGTFSWQADLGAEAMQVFRPQDVEGGKYVVVLTRTLAFLIDHNTGEVVKSAGLDFAAASNPVATDSGIFVGSGSNYFICLWVDIFARRKWQVWSRADSFNVAPLLGHQKNVFVASHNGTVQSLTVADGVALWGNRQVGGTVEAGLAADNRALYVASMDKKMYAFDALTGTELWDVRLGGQLNQAPMPVGSTVLVVGTGEGLFGVSADKGERKWVLPHVKQVLAHGAERAMVIDDHGNLLVVLADTGVVEKTVALPEVKMFASNELDATVFAVTNDGRLAAIDRQP